MFNVLSLGSTKEKICQKYFKCNPQLVRILKLILGPFIQLLLG